MVKASKQQRSRRPNSTRVTSRKWNLRAPLLHQRELRPQNEKVSMENVGGGNSQEIPDESRHKGGHPCLLAHAHSSSQPVSHAQVARCGGVPQNDTVCHASKRRALCRRCEQIFPPPWPASFLAMRWCDGGNLA